MAGMNHAQRRKRERQITLTRAMTFLAREFSPHGYEIAPYANLSGANLYRAINLTQEQLYSAKQD